MKRQPLQLLLDAEIELFWSGEVSNKVQKLLSPPPPPKAGVFFFPLIWWELFFALPPQGSENGGEIIISPPGSREWGGNNLEKIGACGGLTGKSCLFEVF